LILLLLKTFENGKISGMRQQILKALANPARIFYVPYSIAVLNFVIQFIIFVAAFTAGLLIDGITGGNFSVDPLYFLISVCAVHAVLAAFSKKEPQLANIIAAKIHLFKFKVPNQLMP
jgi:type IV secretory pathway VirB3-like protein